MESFECKDLSAVMTELDQKNAKLNEVLEELARLRSLVGEKVIIFFCIFKLIKDDIATT